MNDRHPLIAQRYDVVGDLPGPHVAETVVPIEHSDTGNLVVEQYDESDSNPYTVEWQPGAFERLVADGVLEETNERA